MKKLTLALALLLFTATAAKAASISIYTVAGANTYQNTSNNPCIFFGPGGSACNSNPALLPFVGDTGGGTPFVPNPLTNTYGDAPGEIAAFAAIVGRDFFLGLDINDDNTPQTLSNVTINFFNSVNANIGNFTFSPSLAVPNSNNGTGFADYILSAGCLGVSAGSGANAVCSNYTPFRAPVGTRSITFTFGLAGYNDGQDKLFLINAGPGGVPTPFDIEPSAVPEPSALLLLGTGLAMIVARLKKRTS